MHEHNRLKKFLSSSQPERPVIRVTDRVQEIIDETHEVVLQIEGAKYLTELTFDTCRDVNDHRKASEDGDPILHQMLMGATFNFAGIVDRATGDLYRRWPRR